MSGVGCAATRDAAPELALGILDGAERAEVLLHIASCPRCQRYVGELASVADGLARLAPEVEPPAGFARRVQAELRGSRRRARRRWTAGIAAVAAAAAIAAAVVVPAVESGPSTPAAAPVLHSVAMVGGNGVRVGHVAVSNTNPASIVVNVDYSVPDGTYALVLHTGPAADRIGSITIAEGRGQWIGAARVPAHQDATLALASPNGGWVCQAALSQAQAT
jgi:putative zinc finger protein